MGDARAQNGLRKAEWLMMIETVLMLRDVRAEIALHNPWADVADILEERVAESPGPFQQGTHQEERRFKIYARSARTSPTISKND